MKPRRNLTYLAVFVLTIATSIIVSQATAQSPEDQKPIAVVVKVDREADVKRLVERMKKCEKEDQTQSYLRKELTQVLFEQFAEMEAARKQQIEAIEKRIQYVKAALDLRAQNAEKIVEARISELLGEPSGLSWDFAMPEVKPLLAPQGIPEVAIDRNLDWKDARILLQSTMQNNQTTLESNAGTMEEGVTAAKEAKQEKLDSTLLLGYGLALSVIDEKKKAIAEVIARQEELKAIASDAEAEVGVLAKKLQGDKRNDPTLSTQYRQAILKVGEKMRKVDELTRNLQSQKLALSKLEMELLPLENEVELFYGKGGPIRPSR